MEATAIIGLDGSTEDKKNGLCCIFVKNDDIVNFQLRAPRLSVNEQIDEWLTKFKENRILLAIDVPMGYPENFGIELAKHSAGSKIQLNYFPRRYTDQFIKEKLKKNPLDIACDKIGRTTFKTLERISDLERPIPIIWDKDFDGIGMIEVYPAATLIANFGNKKVKGYTKDPKLVFERLKEKYPMQNCEYPENNIHNFDALICCLAGFDFLKGQSYLYEIDKESTVKKEGWIWVKENHTQ